MTDTDQCDNCPTDCDKCGEPREQGEEVGDWCQDCATTCEACGEPSLNEDLIDGLCPTCDGGLARCEVCGEREDRGCSAACTGAEEVHVTDGRPCWCEPVVEEYEEGAVVIHRDHRTEGH